jgi:hypothetical protein
MTPRVFCGTFEGEAYWREPGLAKLPALPDSGSSRVVEAMDEMLFAFCAPGDTLLTARRMDDAHADYLHSIGFSFVRNLFDLTPPGGEGRAAADGVAPNIFQRMVEERVSGRIEGLCPAGARLEPFAVLPGTAAAARRYGLGGVFPDLDVVREVNTKGYSLRMRDRLGVENVGVIVDDVTSLLDRGEELLRHGPILVKDDYGVSGKGNLLIEAPRTLQRVGRHVSAQTAAGKCVRFVLEPLLRKSSDFSCQFRVGDDGRITVLSVQELLNNGLAFGASCSAGAGLLDRLEREGYFRSIERLGSLLYEDGYSGDVCVDSMILDDGRLFPLVEINARKSMSLIKHAIDGFLEARGRNGRMTYVSTMNDRSGGFRGLLELLERERLLFPNPDGMGVLPLTSGTMYPASSCGPGETHPGRLYVAAVAEGPGQQAGLVAELIRVMERSGLRRVQARP